ncbi:L,D-transpeptidase [Bacillus sp. HMF5848]|uniref:L,D-transpeptidase n=1 Tax=Bacillus sp. HMF5848 TaxID=2495421 RepID=UPI000F7846E1|nr:L,D-transpeptidase [Bacillus sp. HMF5848]RSK27769.1 L,D-transpeptidase [Bacillus sp. HMF5848]
MKLIVMLALVFSPIWPLGVNPIIGDPFIIINKKTNELTYIDDATIQGTYIVATGVTNDLTPEGLFTVTVKAKDPYYRKKDIPGGSPDNPLGTRWIGFDADNTDGRIFGIHGTNNPDSIGKYVSNGCVRMNNNEVEALFNSIPLGTRILIVNTDKSFAQLGKEYRALP